MKFKIDYIPHLTALLLLFGVLYGCSNEHMLKEVTPPTDNPDIIPGRPLFKLSVAPIEDYYVDRPTTRHTAEVEQEASCSVTRENGRSKTRSLGSIGEDGEETIDNVWVLHYNGTEDSAQLLAKEFITEIGDDYLIQPNLVGSEEIDLKDIHTVCFLANTNNSSQFENEKEVATLGDFKKVKSRVYADQYEITNNGVNLPMAAVYTGKINTAIKEIRLERMVAKITFSFSVKTKENHSFTPVAIQLQECRSSIPFFKHEAELDAGEMTDYLEYNMVKLKPGQEITWYIAENLKGVVENIKYPHQKGGLSAPIFASNIMIYGYYQKPKSNGELESFPVVYRVYLGENNTTDFNVKRNHHYIISANILDSRTTDKRVIQPNVALYYFAENNLKAVNTFVEPTDKEYPLGAYWQWGRNKPYLGHKYSREIAMKIDDPRWWNSNVYCDNNQAKAADTWSSIIQRLINVAPETYVGENLNYMAELTGDPCPKGYHIPTKDEWNSITVSDAKNEYIEVRGVKGEYAASFKGAGNITYGIKFISPNTTNYLVAYRWEWVSSTLKIRARYLGQSGRKVTIEDVSKEEFWERNTHLDLERTFPNKAILDPWDSNPNTQIYYWASDSRDAKMAHIWRRTGVDKLTAELSSIKKAAILPIRCMRN